jgi:hypothetical protein
MRNSYYKRAIETIAEQYEEARDEAFSDAFKVEAMKIITNNEICTKDDIQGFLDNWTFPDELDWCENKFNEERGAYEDAKYQEMKDEGIIK